MRVEELWGERVCGLGFRVRGLGIDPRGKLQCGHTLEIVLGSRGVLREKLLLLPERFDFSSLCIQDSE